MENLDNNIDEKPKSQKALKWVLILGIMLVVNLFFNYAIAVFYDEPEYDNFCEEKQVRIIPETQEECLVVGGQWTEDRFVQKTLPRTGEIAVPVIEEERKGYCDPNYTCGQEYKDAKEIYERNVFVILVILGVALIVGSLLIAGFEAVSLGLSLGGVLSLIIGTMRYWSNMDDYLRVIVLGIALATLIWLGIKKFKD